ncbi:MAG: PAS domain S-box protein [Anaerolineales bacterium]|nr:PAS domain S-box protein [Anaerolineales bacterium]
MGPSTSSENGLYFTTYPIQVGNKPLWLFSALLTPGVILYIELGRRFGFVVPIPFLLLFAAVVLASSISGRLASILAASLASAFIIYASSIDYGPQSLTGGVLQMALGIGLMFIVGYNLGYTRDQNRALTRFLRERSADLTNQVARSTAVLYRTNQELEREIESQQATAAILHEREQQLAAIVNSNIDLICRFTPDTRLVFVNDTYCRYFGRSREELLGHSFLNLVSIENVDDIHEHIALLLSDRTPMTSEVHGVGPDDEEHWIQWVDQVVETADGQMLIQAVGRDITEQRRSEMQLRQRDRLAAIGQLAAGIAHDFNNILAVISIYAQLLIRVGNIDDASRQKLQIIDEQTERATSLTNKILDYSRRSVMSRRSLDLCGLWTSTIEMLKRILPENIELELGESPGQLLVYGDETRLQQVFLNLVVNARDALPDGGRICIKMRQVATVPDALFGAESLAEPDAGWAEIVVADNGVGVAATALPHIFEPFYSTKAPGKGTGLGLAQVHGIIKQHGGDILVESEPGKGTVFTIYLPALAEKTLVGVAAPPDELVYGQGELLLLVEDDAQVLAALVDGISALQYRTVTATNGVEALAILKNSTDEIALVVSDAVMPDMGGIGLLQAMQTAALVQPLIIVTGHPLDGQLEQLQAAGLAAYLTKPYSLEQLSVTIAKVLAG